MKKIVLFKIKVKNLEIWSYFITMTQKLRQIKWDFNVFFNIMTKKWISSILSTYWKLRHQSTGNTWHPGHRLGSKMWICQHECVRTMSFPLPEVILTFHINRKCTLIDNSAFFFFFLLPKKHFLPAEKVINLYRNIHKMVLYLKPDQSHLHWKIKNMLQLYLGACYKPSIGDHLFGRHIANFSFQSLQYVNLRVLKY